MQPNLLDTTKQDNLIDISNFIFALLGEEIVQREAGIEEYKKALEELKEKKRVAEKDQAKETDQAVKDTFELFIKDYDNQIKETNHDIRTTTESIRRSVSVLDENDFTKENICLAASIKLKYMIGDHEGFSLDKIEEAYKSTFASVKEVLTGDISKDPILKNNLFSKLLNIQGKNMSDEKKNEIKNFSLTKEEMIYNFQQNIKVADITEFFEDKKAKLFGDYTVTRTNEKKGKETFSLSMDLDQDNVAEYAKALRDMKKILDSRKFKDKIFNARHRARMDAFNKAKEELIKRGVSRFYLNSYLRSSDKDAEKKLNKMFNKSIKDIEKYNKKNQQLKTDLKITEKSDEIVSDYTLSQKEKAAEQKLHLVDATEEMNKKAAEDDFIIENAKVSDGEAKDINEDELNFDINEIVKISDNVFDETAIQDFNTKELFSKDEKQIEELEF